MLPCDDSAREIANNLLERTGLAIKTHDFKLFRPCFLLPQELQTFNGRSLITTPDELQVIFDGVTDHMRRTGVTDMVRNCVSAAFQDEDTLWTTHETRLLSGKTLLTLHPYPVFSVVRKTQDSIWQIAHSKYAITDAPELCRLLGNSSFSDGCDP